MKKKILVALLAVVLTVSCVIGTTLAWLTDNTETVTNTFTYGDINITLDEADVNDEDNDNDITERVQSQSTYKMIPGNKLTKDPTVTVEPNSEACWLFVKIVEDGKYAALDEDGKEISNTYYYFDDYIEYAIDSGWTVMTGYTKDTGDSTEGNETIVIYRKVEATDNTTTEADKFSILAAGSYSCNHLDTDTTDDTVPTYSWSANEVLVKPCITKQMMKSVANTKDTSGNVINPSLTFTAYAVQQANTTTSTKTEAEQAVEAWAIASTATN